MKWIYSFIMLLFLAIQVDAQRTADVDFVLNVMGKEINKVKSERKTQYKIDISGYLPFMFTLYKNYLSSQDFNSCVYYPSCSAYAIEAIHKRGLIKGGLMTFDRLIRCNPSAIKLYELDMNEKRLMDMVE